MDYNLNPPIYELPATEQHLANLAIHLTAFLIAQGAIVSNLECCAVQYQGDSYRALFVCENAEGKIRTGSLCAMFVMNDDGSVTDFEFVPY